jgi:hypothetical protein
MDEAALEELCNSLASLRTEKDWRNKLQSCEQVAAQLLNMPDRTDSQFDKLLATTINYLLLAQSVADVDIRLHAEEVLVRVVRAVSSTNRQRLIEVFLRSVRLRFTRPRCVALSWLATLASVHLRPASCSQFANYSLAPVLELMALEEEEDVHKCLAAALAQLFPVIGRYYELNRLIALLDCLLRKLVGGTDARSRYVGEALCSVCLAPPREAQDLWLERTATRGEADTGRNGGDACSGQELLANRAVHSLLERARGYLNAEESDGGGTAGLEEHDDALLGCLVGLGRLAQAALPQGCMLQFAGDLTRLALRTCERVLQGLSTDARLSSAALQLLDLVFSRLQEADTPVPHQQRPWRLGGGQTARAGGEPVPERGPVDFAQCLALLKRLVQNRSGRVRQSHLVAGVKALTGLMHLAPIRELMASGEIRLTQHAAPPRAPAPAARQNGGKAPADKAVRDDGSTGAGDGDTGDGDTGDGDTGDGDTGDGDTGDGGTGEGDTGEGARPPSLIDLLLALTRHEDPALSGQALCAYAAAAACYLAHGLEMLDPSPHPWPELWAAGAARASSPCNVAAPGAQREEADDGGAFSSGRAAGAPPSPLNPSGSLEQSRGAGGSSDEGWGEAPDALQAQTPGWHWMREEAVGVVLAGMREASAGVRRLAIEAAASLLPALALVSCPPPLLSLTRHTHMLEGVRAFALVSSARLPDASGCCRRRPARARHALSCKPWLRMWKAAARRAAVVPCQAAGRPCRACACRGESVWRWSRRLRQCAGWCWPSAAG